MESTPLLNWLLIVLFLVVALQSVFLAVAMLVMNARIRRFHSKSERNLHELSSFLSTADTTLSKVSDLSRRFADWEIHIRDATEAACGAVAEVDEKVERGLSFLEANLKQWQGQSDEIMVRFSRTSNEIYDAVLKPASRASLVLRAVGAGLKRLLSDSEAVEDPSHYHQDRQIFI